MNTVFHTTRFCSLLAFVLGASASGVVLSADLAGDYNQGVQQYQQSKFDEAATSFKRAATSSNDDLAAKSRYNLGNSLYAKAANLIRQSNQDQARLGDAQKSKLQGLPTAGPSSDQEVSPIELLEDAVGAYRSSLRLNPDDEDARFNLENATRLIDQLKSQQSDQKSSSQEKDEKKKQNQEQDPAQKQQEEDQEDKPKQDSESQSEKPDENGEPENPKGEDDAEEKNDPQDGEKEGEGNEKQPPESDQGSPDQPSDEQSGEEQPDESQQQDDAQPGSGSPNGQTAAKEMTAQEAKEMLQAIRDRDMQRRERLEALKRSRRVVVPRDW